MSTGRFSKFDHFFSAQPDETGRMRLTQRLSGGTDDRLPGSLPMLERGRRSYSIENTLKLIKQKEDIHSRVTDFLTSRKLGHITEEQNKELKQLRNYNEGNRTKEQTLVFLKQLKKEMDEYTAQIRELQEQCAKMEQTTKKTREKLKEAAQLALLTEETASQKQKQSEQLQQKTDTALYHRQVYNQMIARGKEHNIWLKGKLVEIRQLHKNRTHRLQSLSKAVENEQVKACDESLLADEFHDSIRRSSVQLVDSLGAAQQTIDSKSQLLKQMASNQLLKGQAAYEYEQQYLSDKTLWKKLRVHRFYQLILNHKHFRLEESNAPMEHAFAVVKMRTAIKDPYLFWTSYFQSSRTFEELKERARGLEEKQQLLEQTNRRLTNEYIGLVLQSASEQERVVGVSFSVEKQAVPLSTYQHIDQATSTLSKVTLWASRMQYKLRPLLKKRMEVAEDTSKNEMLIRMFLQLVQERLLHRK